MQVLPGVGKIYTHTHTRPPCWHGNSWWDQVSWGSLTCLTQSPARLGTVHGNLRLKKWCAYCWVTCLFFSFTFPQANQFFSRLCHRKRLMTFMKRVYLCMFPLASAELMKCNLMVTKSYVCLTVQSHMIAACWEHVKKKHGNKLKQAGGSCTMFFLTLLNTAYNYILHAFVSDCVSLCVNKQRCSSINNMSPREDEKKIATASVSNTLRCHLRVFLRLLLLPTYCTPAPLLSAISLTICSI